MSAINWTNVTTFEGFLRAGNTATDGVFWTAMLFMLWIIMGMSLIGFGFEVAVMGASFFALILGILLMFLGLTSGWVVGIFVAILLLMFLYVVLSRKD